MFNSEEKTKLKKMGFCETEIEKRDFENYLKLKNILVGITLLASLIGHGAGKDVAILILEYIGWLWIARAAAIEPCIFEYFKSQSEEKQLNLLWQSNFLEHIHNLEKIKNNDLFKKTALTHKKKTLLSPLNLCRIQNITSRSKLFKEYYAAANYPTCMKEIENFASPTTANFYARFNPAFDLIAHINHQVINIMAFGGKERADGGLALYCYICYDEDYIISADWSPNGEYLMILTQHISINISSCENSGGRKITLLKYNSKTIKVREIITKNNMYVARTQSSNCLWITSNSFIIPTSLWGPLLLATIEDITINTQTIFLECKDVRKPRFSSPGKYYSGCFFGGNGFDDIIFWITNCSKNHGQERGDGLFYLHSHCNIVAYNLLTKSIVATIAVPGYVLEIQTIKVFKNS